jgi:hypothetical protein
MAHTLIKMDAQFIIFEGAMEGKLRFQHYRINKTRNLRCGSFVARTGRFSNLFMADLARVAELSG